MLRTTHTSTVTEDQIDHLGHMNVRFYGVNAHAGTEAVLRDLPGWGGPHDVHSIYTRHHREQLLGTDLVVKSAVLGADADGVRIHHELAAVDTSVLAATFVHVVSPLGEDGQRAALPDELMAVANAEAIAPPDYAATRTISLDHDLLASAPTLDEVRKRELAMRKQRVIDAAECDARGRYRVDLAPMLVWAGEPVDDAEIEWLHTTSTGELMGWAIVESRLQSGSLPRESDRIQSFGALVAMQDKVTHRIQWAYDIDSGELLTVFEVVNLAFDINSRRPMSIPEGHRQQGLDQMQPDLGPRPAH